MRDGWGIEDFIDGRRYEGEWKENKYCGRGTLTRKDGEVIEGIWKDDGDEVICENSKGIYEIPKHLL